MTGWLLPMDQPAVGGSVNELSVMKDHGQVLKGQNLRWGLPDSLAQPLVGHMTTTGPEDPEFHVN